MQSLPHTFEVAQQTFQSDVVQRSQQTPVVLLFWTDQVPVSVETKSILERLATQFNGKFVLGLIDVAREPLIARQLQIQGVPSLRVLYQGAIAMQAEGPQSELQLRDLIQQITMSSGEKLQSTLEEVLAREDWDQALKIVRQSLLDEPTNHLDLEMREALTSALNQYEGAVLMVAHDQQLLRECADEFWLVRDGAVTHFMGDLDDYEEMVSRSVQVESPKNKKPDRSRKELRRERALERENRKESVQRRKQLEQTIHELQKELNELSDLLSDSDALREIDNNELQAIFAKYGRSTITWYVASSIDSQAFAVLTATPRSLATSARFSNWALRAASTRRKLWYWFRSPT